MIVNLQLEFFTGGFFERVYGIHELGQKIKKDWIKKMGRAESKKGKGWLKNAKDGTKKNMEGLDLKNGKE